MSSASGKKNVKPKRSGETLKYYPGVIVKAMNSGDPEVISTTMEKYFEPTCTYKAYCTDQNNPYGPMFMEYNGIETLGNHWVYMTQAIPDLVVTHSNVNHASYKSLRNQLDARKIDANRVTMKEGAIMCVSYAYKLSGIPLILQ